MVRTLIFLLVSAMILHETFGYNKDAIKLQEVNAITFQRNRMTNGRRTAPIEQLKCVGGSARGSSYEPDVVQCKNVGTDDQGEVQWRCESELDSSVKFGRTTVSCEGYNYAEDPYVLKGSCGLEYTLEYTQGSGGGASHNNYYYDSHRYGTNSAGAGNIIVFIIIVIVVIGLARQCSQNQHIPSSGAHPSGGAGGYPGGGYPGGGYPGGPGSYPGSYPPGCDPYTNTYTYRPGFWSGFGTGGFMGYMMGRNSGYTSSYVNRPSWGWGSGYGSGYGGYGGGSFGGGRGTPSGTRNATAFASTTRR